MRFELIDRVIDRDDQHLIAVKCVSSAEEYLADHFPGFAVLPGVMMLEAMVQAGRALLSDRMGDGPLVLTDVRNVRYGNMVRPGQCLAVRVKLRKQDADGWDLEGSGSVEDQVAVQGRFRLTPLGTAMDRTDV